VRDGGKAAARGIAHEAQSGDRRERCRERRDGRTIRFDGSLKPEFLAREHHRDAMIADRSADEQNVAA